MKRLSKEAAERALQERSSESFTTALRAVPDGVSPALVVDALLYVLSDRGHGPWFFGRNCRALPEHVIEALLVRLAEEPMRDRAIAIFLRESMRLRGELSVREAWNSALLAVLDLTSSYAWGAKPLKAKFRALADNPRMLAAIQAAVVGARVAPLSLLGVLATHGGEEAADALLTVFERGQHGALEQLATHAAKTPAMDSLLASSTEAAEATERNGPFSNFALATWGVEMPRGQVGLRFHGDVASTPGHARYYGIVYFSTSGATWWSVSLTDTTIEPPGEGAIGFGATFG